MKESLSKTPSIDLVYERAMKQYDIVALWMQAIDSKVALIMGTSVIAFSVMVGISTPNLILGAKLIPFACGAALFIATIIFLLQCLKTRSFDVISNPATLINHYIRLEPEKAKLAFIKHSVKHYRTNTRILKQRAKNLNGAIGCLIAEIIVLFIGIIIV
jgi:hypothetical protein